MDTIDDTKPVTLAQRTQAVYARRGGGKPPCPRSHRRAQPQSPIRSLAGIASWVARPGAAGAADRGRGLRRARWRWPAGWSCAPPSRSCCPATTPAWSRWSARSERIGDMSLLLMGIRSPDRAANLRYAEALTTEAARAAAQRDRAGHLPRARRARFLRGQQVAVPRPRRTSTTIRDRLRKEVARRKNPLLVDSAWTRTSRSTQLKKRLPRKDPLDGRFPDGVLQQRRRHLRLDRGPAPGRDVRRARRREPALGRAGADRRSTIPARYHPEMAAHVAGPVATADRQPPRDRERHRLGDRHLRRRWWRCRSCCSSGAGARSRSSASRR